MSIGGIRLKNQIPEVSLQGNWLTTYAASPAEHQNAIKTAKRLYAKQTILDASKRFGFRVTSQHVSKNGNIQLKLSR